MKENKLVWSSFIIMVIMMSGCGVDDEVLTPNEQLVKELSEVDKAQLAIDTDIIDTYLLENNLTAIIDGSGLRYIVHETGTGIKPELTDQVTVNYRGTLLSDNTEFESGDEIRFILNNVIVGWKVGLQLLKEGSTATLYIPSGLAYGAAGTGNSIPPNANLVFEVDLLHVKRSP